MKRTLRAVIVQLIASLLCDKFNRIHEVSSEFSEVMTKEYSYNNNKFIHITSNLKNFIGNGDDFKTNKFKDNVNKTISIFHNLKWR
jgi:uncharacterized protein with ATP-grasp and redox domains